MIEIRRLIMRVTGYCCANCEMRPCDRPTRRQCAAADHSAVSDPPWPIVRRVCVTCGACWCDACVFPSHDLPERYPGEGAGDFVKRYRKWRDGHVFPDSIYFLDLT